MNTPQVHPNPLLPAATHAVVGLRGEAIGLSELERLERLDDAVFGALSGDPAALDAALERWREATGAVDGALVEESRRHYLQRARMVWRESQTAPCIRLPQALAALEILALLGAET